MTLIAKPFTFVADTEATASEVNADFDLIYNDYNGNITDANIKANAGISLTKIDFTTQLGPILRSATSVCISVGTTGDAFGRWAVYGNGIHSWQNGVGDIVGLSRDISGGDTALVVTNGSASPTGFGGMRARTLEAFNVWGDTQPTVKAWGAVATLDFGPGGTTVPDLSLKRESSTTLALKNGVDLDSAYRNFHCAAITATTLTVSTPIVKANINNGVVRKVINISVVNGTITDGATYTVTCPVHRAGTITGIKASIGTAIVGGTSTLTITKNGTTTLLSTPNIDPTTIAANTATTLTLTATGADLSFAAGDIIKIVHVAGTQGTDGIGEAVSVEYETTDF